MHLARSSVIMFLWLRGEEHTAEVVRRLDQVARLPLMVWLCQSARRRERASSRRGQKGMRRRRAAIGVVSILGALLVALGADAADTGTVEAARHEAGVYAGPADPAGVSRFQRWSGEDVRYVLEFTDRQSWSGISSSWLVSQVWGPNSRRFAGRKLVLSVPMIPGTGGSLAEGAGGAYDAHFRSLARELRRQGLGDRTVIRPGWEFNAGWAAWSAAPDPAAYAAYFRRIVTTMRAVAPSQRFDWCVAEGLGQFWGIPGGLGAAYPGNRYVDYIGMDVYDQAWGVNGSVVSDPAARWRQLVHEPGGLAWQVQFATKHHKSISFPEWALTERSDMHGGGDDPYFVRQMYRWIVSHAVAYQIYFNFDAPDGAHALDAGHFPSAASEFRRLFGSPTPSRSGSRHTSAVESVRHPLLSPP
jgi:hypothetical protein